MLAVSHMILGEEGGAKYFGPPSSALVTGDNLVGQSHVKMIHASRTQSQFEACAIMEEKNQFMLYLGHSVHSSHQLTLFYCHIT